MKVKQPHKYYKGIFYWYSYNTKKWYCDLFTLPEENPFNRQVDVKNYISDYCDNRDYENKGE